MAKLENKVAIVTGGAAGIGRAICEAFAAEGAKVALLDFDETGGTAAADDIDGATFHRCDVSDLSSVQEAFQAVVAQHGSIDILVNNAGIAHIGTASSTSAEDFGRILDVNVKGVYHCLHTALPTMVEQQSGAILNLSSIAAITGIPDRFAYSTAKGAVHTMTFSVATDYINDGIRCNCVCPARVHTPFVDGYLEKNYPDNRDEMFAKLSAAQPIGRMGQPEEIAELALYLCSESSSFITGQAFPIDGGFMNVR